MLAHELLGLDGRVADRSDDEAARAEQPQRRKRVGVEAVAGPRRRRTLDAEDLPDARVRLAARGQAAEDAHQREARNARGVGGALPQRRLVEERLADVEDDGLHSHDATSSRSSRRRDLEQPRVARDRLDPAALRLDERGAVRPLAGGSAAQRIGEERLRRLRHDEPVAVERLDDLVPLDALHRVRDGKHRHRAVVALGQRRDARGRGRRRSRAAAPRRGRRSPPPRPAPPRARPGPSRRACRHPSPPTAPFRRRAPPRARSRAPPSPAARRR